MNWAIFSWAGYVSVALWLCMPALWLLHEWRRPRRWFAHAALGAGIVALALATVNSHFHVNRIQVDRSEQIAEQQARQAMARKAAEAARAEEVADVRFAEDASGDYLDAAGMNQADLEYFESFGEGDTPAWKQHKQQRTGADDDASDLQAMIGGGEKREGLASEAMPEEPTAQPILMPDKDLRTAHRLDGLNLAVIRVLLVVALAYVLIDYLRRLNRKDEAYLPLPLPSRWADALTPRQAVAPLDRGATGELLDDLRTITRRGEAFVCMTENAETADLATTRMPRLPGGLWPNDVLNADDDGKLTDDFVFETVWFGRHSFVVDSSDRAEAMVERFVERLAERRGTRAHTRQTVHVIWDLARPLPEAIERRFAKLGQATGYRLLVRRQPMG